MADFKKMYDKQIRDAVYQKLFRRYKNTANVLVLEEVGLRHGSARIDFLTVKDRLHGYELKGDKDSLYRLENQMPVYNSVLDRVTLIVGYRLADKAMRSVPDWWGVKLAHLGNRGAIHFHDARGPKNNPNIEKVALAKLLWQEQALEVLKEIGADAGVRSKPRKEIYVRLAQSADLDLIRKKVCHYLRLRRTARPVLR